MTPITLTHILTVIVTLYTVESLSDDDIAKMLDERALREQFRDRREYPSNDDIDAFKERIDAIKRRNQDSNELFDTVESDDGAVDENAVHNDIIDTDGISMDTDPHVGRDDFLQRLQVPIDEVRQGEPHHQQTITSNEQNTGLYQDPVKRKTLDERTGKTLEVLNKYGIRAKEQYYPRVSNTDNGDFETSVANTRFLQKSEIKSAGMLPESVSETSLNGIINTCNFGISCSTGPSRKSFNAKTEKRGGLKTIKRFLCNRNHLCRSKAAFKWLGMTPESASHSISSGLKNKIGISTETTDQELFAKTTETTARPTNTRLRKGTQMRLGEMCLNETCLKPTTISSQQFRDDFRMKDSLLRLQKKSNTQEMHLIDILNQASTITNNDGKQYHPEFTSTPEVSDGDPKTANSIYQFLGMQHGTTCGSYDHSCQYEE